MIRRDAATPTVLIVAQAGRLEAEAVLCAASIAETSPGWRIVVAEPQPGPLWPEDPRMAGQTRAVLDALGATIRPVHCRHFGAPYPYGNKIEALRVLDPGTPFLFLDSDTLVLSDLDVAGFGFDRPGASLRVADTWPEPQPYIATRAAIWGALYARFGLDYEASLDRRWPARHWRRHAYFNAGAFFGPCPRAFGDRFTDIATAIRDDPGDILACQSLDPWLDQVALPLTIIAEGGGRDAVPAALDDTATCHWRRLELLYARENDAAVAMLEHLCRSPTLRPVLDGDRRIRRLVHEGMGARIRGITDRPSPLRREASVRARLRRLGLWLD